MIHLFEAPDRPKIGLVLSSGGSRGSAHIGVLKAMASEQIPIDIVVGASIGSVIGGAYAAGVPVAEIEREWLNINIWKIARNLRPSFSLSNWSSGAEALKFFFKLVGDAKIEALSKKFAAVATDIETGEQIVISRGSLAQAMRASSSIPMLMAPVFHDERYLADGGMINPVPVNIARALGAEFVIAVDANAKPLIMRKQAPNEAIAEDQRAKRRPPNLIETLSATVIIWQRRLAEYSLREHPPDILIQPNFYADFFGYHHGQEGVIAGEKAAREALLQLAA